MINLIIEISGFKNEDKHIKKLYTENQWLPAVNSIRSQYPEIQDEWDFIEITDIKLIKNCLTQYFAV